MFTPKHVFYRNDAERLERHLARYSLLKPDIPGGVGIGWQPLVGEAALSLDLIAPGWQCAQIKEKFGTLSFYVEAPTHANEALIYAVYAVVQRAQARSAQLCEWCGDYGKTRKDNWWLLTLCDACQEERERGHRPWDTPENQ